jgi:hypothetical protein
MNLATNFTHLKPDFLGHIYNLFLGFNVMAGLKRPRPRPLSQGPKDPY